MILPLLLLRLCLYLVTAAATDDALRELEGLAKLHGGLIPFANTDDYFRYVRAPERHYDLAIVITAGDRWPCPLCQPAVRTFQMFGAALQREGAQSYATSDHNDDEKRVPFFLGVVDASANIEIAEFHGVAAVPYVAFLPHGKNLVKTAAGKLRFPLSMAASSSTSGPSGFLAQVKSTLMEWSGRDVELIPSTSERVGTIVTILVGAATVTAVGWKLLLVAQRDPTAMAVCAIIAQYFATSGLVWGLIHGFRNNGNRWFLFDNRRAQTATEGFLTSLAVIACGFSIWGATVILRKSQTSSAGELTIAALLLTIGILLWVSLSYVIQWKGGLQARFLPPPNYVKGRLLMDRGNTF